MRKVATIMLAAGIVWAMAGCGSSKASTPQEAIKNFQKALQTGDKSLFLATVDYQPEQKALMETMVDMMSEGYALEQAMEKQYGAGKGLKNGPSSDMKFEGVDVAANWKIEADKAKFDPKGGKDLSLVKKDGAWKVVPEKLPTGKDAEKFQKMAGAMVKVMKDSRAKVGKSGYTAEKINEEFGADMMKAMMAGAGKE